MAKEGDVEDLSLDIDSVVSAYITNLHVSPSPIFEELPITYGLYMKAIKMMEENGINIQLYLPPLLKLLDPMAQIPIKISNLTRKVKKYLGSHTNKVLAETELIKSIHPSDLKISGFSEKQLLEETLPKSNPTIGDMLCLRSFLRVRQLPWHYLHKWVIEMFKLCPEDVDASSLISQCNRFYSRKRSSASPDFLNELYQPPAAGRRKDSSPCRSQPIDTPLFENDVIHSLKQKLQELNNSLATANDKYKQLEHNVHQQDSRLVELTKIAKQYYKQKQQLKELRASLTTRNVNKRIANRDKIIEKFSLSNNDLQQQNSKLKNNIITAEQKKTNAQKLASHYYNKCLKQKSCLQPDDRVLERLDELEVENESLKEKIEDHMEKDIATFTSNKYDDHVRQCYIDLLSMGVSVGRCESVVRSVLGNMTERTADRLPSKATASLLQVEAQILSEQQALDVILSHKDSTLHTDNTKKRGREYAGVQVSVDSLKPIFLDIVEMTSGDSGSVLDALKLTLSHLAENVTSNEEDKSQMVAKLLFSLKNLMTDRHIVNKKIVKSLEEWRSELLPEVISTADLTEENKINLVSMNSLFCGLHVIVNMASEAKKGLKQYQDVNMSPEKLGLGFKTCNARSYDLIYQVCKALTTGPERQSDQKSGYGQEFSVHMEGLSKEIKLVPFLGNRFNILFHDGAATYFHRNDIKEFLAGGYISESNDKLNFLLQCILEQIQVDLNLAGCRSLGIVDKLITGPLWRKLNESGLHILDMNQIWKKVVDFLRKCSIDSSPMLREETVFDEGLIKKDEVYRDLFLPSKSDVELHTKGVLEFICATMVILCERQLEDHLSGFLHNPSDKLREETKSAPLTNVISESAFADLDRCVQHAPQKSTIAKSAISCYQRNKTSVYLQKLSLETKKRYFNIARRRAPARRKADRERFRDIRRKKLELQHDRKVKKEEKQRKLLWLKKQRSKRISLNGGIWNTLAKMNKQLKVIGGKMKSIQAVRDQITYRIQNTSVSKKKLGKFSVNKKKLTFEELCLNLSLLIVEHPSVEFELPGQLENGLKLSKKLNVSRRKAQVSHSTHRPHTQPSIRAGCYAAIAFDTEWYPAYVEDVDSVDLLIKVRFLHRRGGSFFWPEPADPSDSKPISKVFAFSVITCEPKNLRLWSVQDVDSINREYESFRQSFMM